MKHCKKEKNLKRKVCIVLSVSIVFWIAGFFNQKRQYPSTQYKSFAMHQPFTLFDCEYEVTDIKTEDYRKFAEENNLLDSSLNTIQDKNVQILLINVKVKNTSSEEKTVSLYPITLSTIDYSNSLELFTYMDLHEHSSAGLSPTLEPEEIYETELPYVEWGTNWGAREGNIVEKVPLQLTFTLYPTKYSVRLNDLW